jgi:hypothetical protein
MIYACIQHRYTCLDLCQSNLEGLIVRTNLAVRCFFFAITLFTAGWSITSHALVVNVGEFTINRNGALFFTDSFNDGNEPPSAPNFPNGNPASYSVFGTIPNTAEAGGRLVLDTANGALTVNALGQGRLNVRPTLITDTGNDPADLDLGLKSDDTLSISGIFGLTTPPGPLFSAYGLQIGDFGTAAQTTHQLLQLFVSFNVATGEPRISYILQDFDADTITNLGSTLLAPPAGADEILLNLSRPDAASDDVFGSFAYVTGGVGGPSTQFALPGQAFQGEEFVRARFFAAQDLPFVVPEPGTAWLLSAAALSLLAARRRKRL